MDNPNYYDLDPSPCILISRIIIFSHKKSVLSRMVAIFALWQFDSISSECFSLVASPCALGLQRGEKADSGCKTALSGCAAASKAGSGCKTALAAAGPHVSAWSTPWYLITFWACMFDSHASLPALSDKKPRDQWRPKGPWKKNDFWGKKSWLRTEGSWPIPLEGSLWEGEGNGKYRTQRFPFWKYFRELWEVTFLLSMGDLKRCMFVIQIKNFITTPLYSAKVAGLIWIRFAAKSVAI